MTARSITRHSIIEHNGKYYMLENKYKKGMALLIPYGEPGIEISNTTLLNVVKYPAQLAMDYIKNRSIELQKVQVSDTTKAQLITKS